jgi:hypothetical protein
LGPENIQQLDGTLTDRERVGSLGEMDSPENMEILHRLGLLAGRRDVAASHFEGIFDLPRK